MEQVPFTPEQPKIRIRVSDVVNLMNNGATKADVAKHYGLNKSEEKALFSIPALKKVRTVKPNRFVVIEDVSLQDEGSNTTLPILASSPEEDIIAGDAAILPEGHTTVSEELEDWSAPEEDGLEYEDSDV